MFNRYWRTYPWGLQVFLFMTTWFTFFYFGIYLSLSLVPRLTGLSVKDLLDLSANSGTRTIRLGLLAQATSHISTFALPGLVFAGFTHPKLRKYLGLRKPGKSIHWLLVTGVMLGLIPVSLWGENWSMQHLHFGKWANDMQAMGNKTIGAFLHLSSGIDLVLLLCILALLPAVGEEIIFRGILLRLVHRRANRVARLQTPAVLPAAPEVQQAMVFPIVSTALLFTAFHVTSPHGFVFIFIGGCVLGLVYFLTGSLLCSIWAHLLYNGLQVVAAFYSKHNEVARKIAEGDNLPIALPLGGLILFAVCFYLLVKNQTPLPADWSDDFKDERSQIQEAA